LAGIGPPSAQPDAADELHASEILESLAAGTEERVPFSAIVAAAGSRVHGLALLVFALPEVPPLPLPSASTILAIPLIIIAAHLALFGEGSLLPTRVQAVTMPRSVLATAARYLGPALGWIERASRPRWLWIARRERLIGLICLYLSIVLILPIPLLNSPPAACIAAIAIGMIQRDGVFIVAGFVGGLIVTGIFVGIIDVAGGLLLR
jgi:hypothetical protein